jgi:WD40 repeat protein
MNRIIISPDGKQAIEVFEGSNGRSLAALNYPTREKRADLLQFPADGSVRYSHPTFSPDSRLLVAWCSFRLTKVPIPGTTCFDQTFKRFMCMWDTSTWQVLHDLEMPFSLSQLNTVDFSPDSSMIVVTVSGYGSAVCKLRPRGSVPVFREHYKENSFSPGSMFVTWVPSGDFFFIANIEKPGIFFNSSTAEPIGPLVMPADMDEYGATIRRAVFSRDSRWLYTTHPSGNWQDRLQTCQTIVIAWDVVTRRRGKVYKMQWVPYTQLARSPMIAISPANDLLAIGNIFFDTFRSVESTKRPDIEKPETHPNFVLLDLETGHERYLANIGNLDDDVQDIAFLEHGERLRIKTRTREMVVAVSTMARPDPAREHMMVMLHPDPAVPDAAEEEPMMEGGYVTSLFLDNSRLPTKDELRGVATALEAAGIIDSGTHKELTTSIDALVEDLDTGLVFTPQQDEFNIPIELPYKIKHRGAFPFFYSRHDRRHPDGVQVLEISSSPRSKDPFYSKHHTQFCIASVEGRGAEDADMQANPVIAELQRRLARVFDIPELEIVARTHAT